MRIRTGKSVWRATTLGARARLDLLFLGSAAALLFALVSRFDVLPRWHAWTANLRFMQADQLAFAGFVGAIGFGVFAWRRWRESMLEARQQALSQVAVQRNRDLLSAVLQNSPAQIHVKDAKGRYVLANRAFETAFGVAGEQFVGCTGQGLLPAARVGVSEAERHVLSSGEALETEETVGDASARRTLHCIHFRLHGADDNDAVCTLATDITGSRQTEDSLRRAQKIDAVGRLAAGVAHDFNNLLGVITGYTELLTNDLRDDPKKRKRVASIRAAAERALVLTRQLMSLSRRQPLQPRVVDVHAALRTLEPALRASLGEQVQLVLRLDAACARVFIDPEQLDQVVSSLALHARNALATEGIITIATADHAPALAAGPQGELLLTVSDTGAGIPADLLARVFEPFFTAKPKGKSAGLTLAAAHSVVDQSGGQLQVESTPARGTTFTVRLPAVAAPSEERPPAATAAAAPEVVEGTLLVVDDDDALRVVVRETLSSAGYNVIDCPDPSQALAAAAASACIDMLITDCVMPGMSGYQLAQALRGARPGTPVLYMSGQSPRFFDLAAEAPVDFLAKPFTGRTLLERVALRLANVRANRLQRAAAASNRAPTDRVRRRRALRARSIAARPGPQHAPEVGA